MPVKTRATFAVPIKAKYCWCMHCLRTECKVYEPNRDQPLEINCILDAKASILCRQCYRRNATCEQVGFANHS